MLHRIDELFREGVDFAFETTLATKSYKGKVLHAQQLGYKVTLLFFWLPSVDLAIDRVKKRVESGGHNIPTEVIRRRYRNGIINFFNIYLPICDEAILVDNSSTKYDLIAISSRGLGVEISNQEKWTAFKDYAHGK